MWRNQRAFQILLKSACVSMGALSRPLRPPRLLIVASSRTLCFLPVSSPALCVSSCPLGKSLLFPTPPVPITPPFLHSYLADVILFVVDTSIADLKRAIQAAVFNAPVNLDDISLGSDRALSNESSLVDLPTGVLLTAV